MLSIRKHLSILKFFLGRERKPLIQLCMFYKLMVGTQMTYITLYILEILLIKCVLYSCLQLLGITRHAVLSCLMIPSATQYQLCIEGFYFQAQNLVICIQCEVSTRKMKPGDVLFKRKKNNLFSFHSNNKALKANVLNTSVTSNTFTITVKLHH